MNTCVPVYCLPSDNKLNCKSPLCPCASFRCTVLARCYHTVLAVPLRRARPKNCAVRSKKASSGMPYVRTRADDDIRVYRCRMTQAKTPPQRSQRIVIQCSAKTQIQRHGYTTKHAPYLRTSPCLCICVLAPHYMTIGEVYTSRAQPNRADSPSLATILRGRRERSGGAKKGARAPAPITCSLASPLLLRSDALNICVRQGRSGDPISVACCVSGGILRRVTRVRRLRRMLGPCMCVPFGTFALELPV